MKFKSKISALIITGAVIGCTMSAFGSTAASARVYASCDSKIDTMEKQAAKDYKKGKLTAAEYANVQAEIAYHRELWGC